MASDPPEPLDDTSWLAVKGGTVEAVVKVLGLSDLQPAGWARGLEVAAGNFAGAPAGWRRVAGWCRRLSREFGAAHAFTDQAQLDWYSWIVACAGAVVRQVVYEDGEFLSRRGEPTAAESRLAARFRPDEVRAAWCPDVGDVPRIAGGVSVNPWRLGPRTRTAGAGVVAVTPLGREWGVTLGGAG